MSQRRTPRRVMNGKRAVIFLASLCVCVGVVVGVNRAMVGRNANAMLRQAKKAEEDGNTQEAVKLYLDYLNFQPRDADALAGYASLLEKTGRSRPRAVRERIDTYERLLRTDPTRTEERRKLVKLYLDMPFYVAAKDHLDYLLDPTRGGAGEDPELLFQYAVCEAGTGHPAEAVARLRVALATKRAASGAYILLAQLLRNEIKTRDAIDESDQVLGRLTEDKPEDPTARLARCRYLISLGKHAEARKELETAKGRIKTAESSAELDQLHAELDLAEGNVAGAKDVLVKADAANPKNATIKLMLSDVYAKQDELAKAKQKLEEATALLPDDGPALLDAIDRKIDYGMTDAAKKDVERFANREEYQPMADYLTGRLLLAEGNWPAATAKLEKAVVPFERMPRYLAKARLALAECRKSAGNPDQMLADAAAAAKADPLGPAPRLAVAEANALLGKWDEAVPVFKQFADRSPAARAAYVRFAFAEQLARPAAARTWAAFDAAAGSAPYPVEVALLVSRSLALRGNRDGALTLLQEAKKQKPDEPEIRSALALFLGERDPAAGVAAIDEAERVVGDRAAFRLTRARLLAADPSPDLAAVAATGESAAGFRKEERFALYAGLGDLFATRLGKKREAVEWYRRAAAESPFNLPSRIALFRAASLSNQTAAADQALKEIRDLDTPDGPSFLVNDALRQLPGLRSAPREQAAGVRAEVERALRLRASWPVAYALLGELDELTDDAEGALEHYRRAFDLGERSDVLVRRMVQLLCQRNRFEEARRVLDAREQTGNMPADLRQQVAMVDTALGGSPRKAADVVTAAETSKDPMDHLFRGQALMLSGDREGAGKAFEKAVALSPGLIDAWVQLVRVYALAGKIEDAKAAATRSERAFAAVKPPNPATVPTALGDIQQLLGHYRDAERRYQDALTAAPADPTATRRLVELYAAVGRAADAVPKLEAVIASPARDPIKRWARRALAEATTAGPDGFKKLGAAVALLDENLKSGGHAEDERAKAFLLARDPFRRPEAKQLFLGSQKKGPYSPDESAAFARLLAEEGDLNGAESYLREATRTQSVAKAEHLRMLFRVQLARDKIPQAAETLDRLKAVGPVGWEVVAEEVRLKAKAGDKPAAAKLALSFPAVAEPAAQVGMVAPLLIDVGCKDEAEKLLTRIAETTTLPNRYMALARFYLSTGKPEKAIEIAKAFDPKTHPPATRAQVFTAAVAVRPRAVVPPADQPAWDRTLSELAAWVADQLRAAPKDPELKQCEAVIADAQGRYADAIREYEQLLEIAPDSVAAHNNLAFLLATVNKDTSNRPLELVDASIKQAGPKAAVLDTRAVIHLAADRPAEALRDLEAALTLDQNPKYYFHLALAHEKAGNIGRKINAIDTATRLGLKKAALHTAEWPEYERLLGPG